MANYRRVKITNANNYEVNSNGDVFNKHGTKLSKRKDGRHAIVNDDGETKYITASAEFILATYIPGKTPGRYSMGIDFPMYEVDNNANIFNIHRPYDPIAIDKNNGVQIINEFGEIIRINRFRALAIYKYHQKDTGFVRLIDRVYDGGNGKDISNDPLSKKRVKMIHPSLQNVRLEVLNHHPHIGITFAPDGITVIPVCFEEGRPLNHCMKDFRGVMTPHYLSWFHEVTWTATLDGPYKPTFGGEHLCLAPLEFLLKDPTNTLVNRRLNGEFRIEAGEIYNYFA